MFTPVILTLAISNLAFLALYLFLNHRRSVVGTISIVLAICLIARLIAEYMTLYSTGDVTTTFLVTKLLMYRLGNASAFVLWIFSYMLFVDGARIRHIHPGFWALAIGADLFRLAGSIAGNFYTESFYSFSNDFYHTLTMGLSQSVMIGFILASIHLATKGFKSDLIVERRSERIAFSVSVAMLLLVMAADRGLWVFGTILQIENASTLFAGSIIDKTLLYGIYTYLTSTVLFLWVLSSPRSTMNRRSNHSAELFGELEKVSKIEASVIRRIEDAMINQKLYLKPHLTVSELSNKVSVPEYKVRKAINRQLGFKNFCEFLNHYRIQETSRLLLDTEIPISNIGIDVGYSSMSTFYKAFKEKYSLTPKEYRAIHKVKAI
jgi:AraC-like DNA-binding protein